VILTVWVTVSGRAVVVVPLEPSTLTTEYCAPRTSSGLRCTILSGKASEDDISETKLKTQRVDGNIADYNVDSCNVGCKKDCFNFGQQTRVGREAGGTGRVSRRSVPEERVGDKIQGPQCKEHQFIYICTSIVEREVGILVRIIDGGGNVDDEGWEHSLNLVGESVRRHGPRFSARLC
jgi:hypothetical protein